MYYKFGKLMRIESDDEYPIVSTYKPKTNIKDYNSWMVAIYQKWKQMKGLDVLRFLTYDYVQDFEMLEYLVYKEPVSEWASLPITLVWKERHLTRALFMYMFEDMTEDIDKFVDETVKINKMPPPKIYECIDYSIWEAFTRERPSVEKDWKDAKKEKCIHDFYYCPHQDIGSFRYPDCFLYKEMDALSITNKACGIENEMMEYLSHAYSMIQTSCERIKKKCQQIDLTTAHWKTLLHKDFVNYVALNGKDIELSLIYEAQTYINSPDEDLTSKIWAKVYEAHKEFLSSSQNRILRWGEPF